MLNFMRRTNSPGPSRGRNGSELGRRSLVLELSTLRLGSGEGRSLRSRCSSELDLDVVGKVVADRREKEGEKQRKIRTGDETRRDEGFRAHQSIS